MKKDFFNSIEGLSLLRDVFDELDQEIALFKEKTALECPSGCGRCCITPGENIEASLFEMLLPAVELWEKGEAGVFIERIEKSGPEQSPCVLFIPADENQKGRCKMYHNRGLVCRLFGYSGFKDKYGKLKFSTCGRIKTEMKDKINKAEEMIKNGLSLPLPIIFRNKINDLNPMLTRKLYPINTALYLALIKAGYYLKSVINS